MEESVKNLPISEKEAMQYSPLALAYIGDSIYDLKIKEYFVTRSNMQSEKYHKLVTGIVSANAQSEFVDNIMQQLTEQELEIYKRGRNSTPHTKAKNASLSNYLKATGLEAVMGFLYLTGKSDRISELIDMALKFSGEDIS